MSKRDDILFTTLDLINEEGLYAVKLTRIFKNANVGAGTFYNYFDNKEELVNELFKYALRIMGENLNVELDSSMTIYQQFNQYVRNVLDFAIHQQRIFSFIDTYAYSSYIRPEVKNLDETGGLSIFYKLLLDGQEQGVLKKIDLNIAIQIVTGIISSSVKGHLNSKYPLDTSNKDVIVEACWKSIKL